MWRRVVGNIPNQDYTQYTNDPIWQNYTQENFISAHLMGAITHLEGVYRAESFKTATNALFTLAQHSEMVCFSTVQYWKNGESTWVPYHMELYRSRISWSISGTGNIMVQYGKLLIVLLRCTHWQTLGGYLQTFSYLWEKLDDGRQCRTSCSVRVSWSDVIFHLDRPPLALSPHCIAMC